MKGEEKGRPDERAYFFDKVKTFGKEVVGEREDVGYF